MRRRVYIAGAITKGDLAHNINQGVEANNRLLREGFAPFCPMWSCFSTPAKTGSRGTGERDVNGNFGTFEPMVYATATTSGGAEISYEAYLESDFAWIAVCAALLRLPGESKGADMEVAEAKRLGIPVFDSIKALLACAWALDAGPLCG